MAKQVVRVRMPILSINEKFEQLLKQRGVASVDIDKAVAYQKKYGGTLEQLLINLGSLSEDELPAIYADLLQLKLISSLDDYAELLLPSLNEAVNLEFLANRSWLPYQYAQNTITFATSQPLNWEVRQYLETQLQHYNIVVCNEELIEQLKLKSASVDQQGDSLADDLSALSEIEEDRLRELASEAPTVNLLNALITKGLKLGASDMHIEPVANRCRVRYRIDGVLHDADTIPRRLQLPVISRLKILSQMDIAEKRRPQDGKIEIKIANTELDIRVSALPLNDGESMVLRFLRKDSISYDMAAIGLATDVQQWIAQDLKNTAGVILLTGPTGSGKTTTLYTFLNALNNDDVKIITLEDPVEYQLSGINQVQVNSDIGFDFASGLRSIVRQDPDIIMLGEIRDKETASIAMQSALTGHLVFSTVHTNDAPSAFTRLLDLGLEEFLLNAAIIAIVAQRLARKLCEHCKVADVNANDIIKLYHLERIKTDQPIQICKAVGCEQCGHSGYKGRTAIIEYLRCDDEIKAITKDHSFIQAAKKINKKNGYRTLFEDGLLKVLQGETTIDEVVRVAG